LAPIIGTKWAPILFAVALIAAGQSSTITGTLAGQIVMEGYLSLRVQPWVRRILTRSIAIIPSVFAIYYFGESATGKLLVLSQVILSLQLGFAIIPLIHFVSDKHKMKGFEIKMYVRVLAWLSAIIIVLLNAQLVINELQTLWQTYSAYHWLITLTIIPVVLMSMLVLLYVSIKPFLVNYKLNQLGTPHGNLNVINLLERKTFQHVAITVDFSSADNAAFNQAVIQTPAGAKLTLIHIVETAGALVMGNETDDHESEEDQLQMSIYREFLEKKGYLVAIELGYGNPKKQIPILVEKCGADLLIMAAHGHKGIKDFILGTTLDSVRHNVKIPVLIISNKE
jgi:manganese transport protein